MSITREQVADLREGDVVRLEGWYGATIEGPLRAYGSADALAVGPLTLRHESGSARTVGMEDVTLTIVSRAPRPLYVNHPRTEPVNGDAVNPGDGTSSVAFRTAGGWIWANGTRVRLAGHGLRLLVDGETGQVVP